MQLKLLNDIISTDFLLLLFIKKRLCTFFHVFYIKIIQNCTYQLIYFQFIKIKVRTVAFRAQSFN